MSRGLGDVYKRQFFASGRPNHGRCPRPVPTVLPLPFTSCLDKSEVVVKRGTRASGGEISRGLFVFPSALGGESPAQGSSAINRGLVQSDTLNLSTEMPVMQRCPDRYSPDNESLFFPPSIAKLPWRESSADSLGL